MAAGKPRHLHVVVDTQTGEQQELAEYECPNCAEMKRELARFRTITANLRADKEADAHASTLWGHAVALWQEWKIATGHMKSKWSADRFWLCEPYLRGDGFVLCRWGVWGIAYEPNRRRLPSGLWEVYDSWELLHRNRGTWERYVNRGYMNPEARAQFEDREGIGGEASKPEGNADGREDLPT